MSHHQLIDLFHLILHILVMKGSCPGFELQVEVFVTALILLKVYLLSIAVSLSIVSILLPTIQITFSEFQEEYH